jgi:hypothetical protein
MAKAAVPYIVRRRGGRVPRKEVGRRMEYEKPVITDLGSIVDHTFTTPGGHKGCQTNCHLDNFTELSANPATP